MGRADTPRWMVEADRYTFLISRLSGETAVYYRTPRQSSSISLDSSKVAFISPSTYVGSTLPYQTLFSASASPGLPVRGI